MRCDLYFHYIIIFSTILPQKWANTWSIISVTNVIIVAQLFDIGMASSFDERFRTFSSEKKTLDSMSVGCIMLTKR